MEALSFIATADSIESDSVGLFFSTYALTTLSGVDLIRPLLTIQSRAAQKGKMLPETI